MSSATIESPVASSQLFFAWSEQAEVSVAPPRARRQPAVKPAMQPAVKPQDAPAVEPTQPPQTSQSAAAHSRCTPQPGCLSFTRDARLAKPVRMGALMIKLLKRYGITDQEIAEGVANYARKHQQAMAS